MTKPTIKLVNAETGEEVTREMNAEELKQLELDKAAEQAEVTAIADKATAKQTLLDKLGITQEEAALLLGGN
jgi:ParB-like chromosome segregation protein Spo0J